MQRALLDIAAQPELARCSDVLWMLRYLMPPGAVRPIMGERRLGERPIQESWDLALGTHQRALIELGYEGVSIEQVTRAAPAPGGVRAAATAAVVLEAVENATLYLRSRRLADELGTRALDVLSAERSVDGAPEVLRRARRLLAYYRTSEPVLPSWIESFVKAGYAHYCTLLPTAFTDDDATVRQVAAMLGFLFSMESAGAVAGLRPEPAGAGGRPVASGGTGEDGAAVGGPDAARASSPARTCGHGATNCSATPWWCPPIRAISAASSTPWNLSLLWPTSSWRWCRTRSGGCRIRCCCPGCRP